jgi:Flp pilus assembly protein TadG
VSRAWRRLRQRRVDESGTALVEFIWLGLLMLVPLVYVMWSVFDAQRGAFGASAASRAAGRAFVLSPDQETGYDRAEQAARVALEDQGIDVDVADVRITCAPEPDDCLTAGSVITVEVVVQQPLPLVPSALGGSAPSVRLSSTHVEPYGTYREDRP